jgi:isoquinoline 1-oxidoreductase subunit alpha
MPKYTLKINGQAHPVEAAADTPLLWILRDHLNLVGTKYGCGMGLCGACTVHLNGEAVRSCQLPVATLGAQAITTVEGLDPQGASAVQAAWDEIDVPQCGYCQTGQMMSAASLLAKTPHPSDAEIDSAMAGNLCRCGTYARIRAAVHLAAEKSAVNA